MAGSQKTTKAPILSVEKGSQISSEAFRIFTFLILSLHLFLSRSPICNQVIKPSYKERIKPYSLVLLVPSCGAGFEEFPLFRFFSYLLA
jgi:hypothetical protein